MAGFADVIINRKSPAVDRIFTYAVPEALRQTIAVGMLAQAPFNREQLEAVVVELHDRQPAGFAVKELTALLSDKPLFSRELLELSAWIAGYYRCSRAAALQAMLPAGLTLTGRPPELFYADYFLPLPEAGAAKLTPKRRELWQYLTERGACDAASLAAAGFSRAFLNSAVQAGVTAKERRRIPQEGEEALVEATELSREQQAAYEAALAEWQGADRPFLLYGVTGSGKTEIYLRLIEAMAAQGRQSILLTPEIALSAQMVEMLTRRIQRPVAVLHSGLKATERRQIWQDIAEGRAEVVVGARSAVFAPLPRLGLVIIDEEHESSYKQDNVPRFSAVATAEQRCRLSGAHLLLGSATPSVESYHAALSGDYALWELSSHYNPAPPPLVEVVDMRQELRSGNRLIFSRRLLEALSDTMAGGGQSILFLNRRGYYQHFACRDCGASITCPHCAVAMSYHEGANGGWLKCHYCGRMLRPPETCPACGSAHIRHFGVGTQRVEDELRRLFPEARVARLDSDVMEQRGSHERIYQAMRRGEIDILVGTQMVAKGLDFPRVELAAVIAADTMLNLPDWRAAERTYQLITQLIGRAGRRDRQGIALIQTYTPEALPVQAAAAGDYQLFYREELRERQLHGYPPFNHLLRLVFAALDRGLLLSATESFAAAYRSRLSPEDELCGPADAPLSRIKDRWRRQIIVKTVDAAERGGSAEQAWQQCLSGHKEYAAVNMSIDIDPVSMM